ncbi:MAG: glycosyltransferase family 2 protein [Proteobacteria bacterium]|nr:glycosyltransferase family 2 protein [Pseudomonadota bacterium]
MVRKTTNSPTHRIFMNGLSVIIITLNEEKNLPDCLASAVFADEIVVVDSGSTDLTRELAEKHRARVIRQDWLGYGKQKAFALTQARKPWVLSLDADERVSPGLAAEIKKILGGEAGKDGFYARRQNYFLGRLMRHGGWERDWVLRLFRREKGSFTHSPVHERIEVEGKTGRLENPLLHYPHATLDDFFLKMDRYTALSAADLAERGKRAHWYNLLFNPAFRFFRMYVLERGFLDGYPGLVLAGLYSLYVFTRYARLWELNQDKK